MFIEGLDDYITPLDYHMEFLMELQQEDAPKLQYLAKVIGYKVLRYLRFCLFDEPYFGLKIRSDHRKRRLKEELYKYFIEGDREQSFPHARALLSFDSQTFLGFISAFSSGNTNMGRLRTLLSAMETLIIDKSIDCDSHEDRSFSWPYSVTQQGHLLLEMAKLLANESIQLDEYMTRRTIAFLLHSDDVQSRSEREVVLLGLVKFGHSIDEERALEHSRTLGKIKMLISSDYILQKAMDAKFYKVCAFLFEKQNNLQYLIYSLIEIDLADKSQHVYDLIQKKITETDKLLLCEALLQYSTQLLLINNTKFTELIVLQFPDLHTKVFTSVESNDTIAFLYLQGLESYFDKINGFDITPTDKNLKASQKKPLPQAHKFFDKVELRKFFEIIAAENRNPVQFLKKFNLLYRTKCEVDLEDIAQRADREQARAYLLELRHDKRANAECFGIYKKLIDEGIKKVKEKIDKIQSTRGRLKEYNPQEAFDKDFS
eukprot:TRINITY_DN868_c1_g1_i8.p1 TRINITY_DN868_c1_g1~~TRINITY_DN868_c1_g1_i8.p1  ORF type:complete len:487 (+),score=135.25 TRINITY_DN868_c1_g1_i8:196-1656(+)